MANKYSSLYALIPNANSTTYAYEGPSAERRGQAVLRYATFTGTLANGDVLYIAGGFADGEKLSHFTNTRGGDPDTDNDLVFDLGFASDPDGVLNDSTGAQATTVIELDHSDLIGVAGADEGDSLILTAHTGEAEASQTWSFLIESFIP